jgi:hypothetical protein
MTKISIVIANKTGEINNINVKSIDDELYKKCGFKTATEFREQHSYAVNIDGSLHLIKIYGKQKGKSNMVNKYEFPPPIDKILFYGSCAIVCNRYNCESENFVPITMTCETWESIYQHLMGGNISTKQSADEFEEEAILEAEEKEEMAKGNLTKQGYLKDGFVADDDEVIVSTKKQKKTKKEKNPKQPKNPLRKKCLFPADASETEAGSAESLELTYEEY